MSATLLIVGQSTIDHLVPARPGPWREQLGGNALYALAGARLWLDPAHIAVVTRRGRSFPFDLEGLLDTAGTGRRHIVDIAEDHLVEWIFYEPDGARRSLPRNPDLLAAGGEGTDARTAYLDRLAAISPSVDDVSAELRWPAAIYLAPQVHERHRRFQEAVSAQPPWLCIDPSVHYAAGCDAVGLRDHLPRAQAILPSEQEALQLLTARDGDPVAAVQDLLAAGFPEAVIKLGRRGCVVGDGKRVAWVRVPPIETEDPTGAGDAFGGAYAACRAQHLEPAEAARRAVAAARLVAGCAGADAALSLSPREAGALLAETTVESL